MLDLKLTKARLQNEAKNILRAQRVGINTPTVYFVEASNASTEKLMRMITKHNNANTNTNLDTITNTDSNANISTNTNNTKNENENKNKNDDTADADADADDDTFTMSIHMEYIPAPPVRVCIKAAHEGAE